MFVTGYASLYDAQLLNWLYEINIQGLKTKIAKIKQLI